MPKSASVQECLVVTEVIDTAGPLKRQLNEKVENYWKSRPTNAKNDAAKELPKDKTFDQSRRRIKLTVRISRSDAASAKFHYTDPTRPTCL